VTDANVVLGYLPENLLGGAFRLDRTAATRAVQTIADALDVDLFEAARGIIDIVNENMFGALRMISVQQGYDPRDFALMGFGGAGPLHVNAVAQLMGSWPAVSPVSPGVLCALGDATTPMRTEAARSLSRRRSEVTDAQVLEMLRAMEQQVWAALSADGVAASDITTEFEIDVRYSGQAFEVPMKVKLEGFADGGLDRLAEAFDAEHRRLFTFTMEAEQEFVNLRAIALGGVRDIPAQPVAQGDGDPRAARIRDHEMWIDGGMKPGVIYNRAKLRAGDRIAGPAIVVEMDSTTLVLPGCAATVDRFGNIMINPV
jgi:N-methylhydantoinase A